MKEAKTVQEIAELAALIAVAGRAYIYVCDGQGNALAQGYAEKNGSTLLPATFSVDFTGVATHFRLTVHPGGGYYFRGILAGDANCIPSMLLTLTFSQVLFAS